jgi:hypothetical protein
MITVKKVFEKEDKAVYQAYENCVLGEVVTRGNVILSESVAPVKNAAQIRDFMLRSVVFLLSELYDEVAVDYFDPYYEKLGFVLGCDGLKQKSDKIVFPSECGGHGKK